MIVPFVVLALLSGSAIALFLWAMMDNRAGRAEWARLAALQPSELALFDPVIVADLPESARRFFGYTMHPGTLLRRIAEIDMVGRFSLETKEDPAYQPMEARQILAAPDGFVRAMRTRGGMPVSGSDSGSWTRFHIF